LSGPEFEALPGLPQDRGGPVFAEPWQAQAFALAVSLHQAGAFSWGEWAQALSKELQKDPADDGSRYFQHWLAALENLVTGKQIASADALRSRKSDWAEAYRRTPHGKPVEL